jgi:hypothetical protein
MPQFLVVIHHPDNYDASLEGEAMEAAGAGSSPAACNRLPKRNHCGSSPADRWR